MVNFLMITPRRLTTLFPYTTLFRSPDALHLVERVEVVIEPVRLGDRLGRSEEHTSELQSRRDLVCRLLLEKKNRLRVALVICAPIHKAIQKTQRDTLLSI